VEAGKPISFPRTIVAISFPFRRLPCRGALYLYSVENADHQISRAQIAAFAGSRNAATCHCAKRNPLIKIIK
jgi:hypothetical protein